MKPFVKWVGGKRTLLAKLKHNFPNLDNIDTYIEPMVGGGVLTCYMLLYTDIKNIIINDINNDLIECYKMIKNEPNKIIKELKALQIEYCNCENEEKRKDMYYRIRTEYNTGINKAINLIFLNKTCFNGLYRTNGKGEFNTPMGQYIDPVICDEENIKELHKYFKERDIKILSGSYKDIKKFCNDKTFVYIDPPYRPISKTSNFTNYNQNKFGDKEQIELKEFMDELTKLKTKVMISNSDPKNINPNDNFFDDLYKEYNIIRIDAPRAINNVGSNRGPINELIIKNY